MLLTKLPVFGKLSTKLFALTGNRGMLLAGAGGGTPEFMNKIIDYASMGVMAFGAAIAVSGVINFGEGKSQQNAAKQDEGITKIVGGLVIMIVGFSLVPQLSGLLSI
jgi:Aconitase A